MPRPLSSSRSIVGGVSKTLRGRERRDNKASHYANQKFWTDYLGRSPIVSPSYFHKYKTYFDDTHLLV
jgi:hypothetical protein